MKKTILITVTFFYLSILFAQKHDNVWISGSEGMAGGNPNGGQTHLTFDKSPYPQMIKAKIGAITLYLTVAAISDKTGKLALYSDGTQLLNYNHDTIIKKLSTYNEIFSIVQGTMLLPYPEKDSLYLLLYQENGFVDQDLIITKFRYATIDMAKKNGKGETVEVAKNMGTYIPAYGKLSACKHANGKDWWIVVLEYDSNKYHRYLLNKDGIKEIGVQVIGDKDANGVGISAFSPDGTKYARHNNISVGLGQTLDVYDFNRCTGLFSNHQRRKFKGDDGGCGVAFSPSNRYLYVATGDDLMQYDMQAETLAKGEKTVATWDGYISCSSTKMNFYNAQLAPNGKIYLNNWGCARELHVIEKPDLPDTLCQVKQHSLLLPTYYDGTLCNFPNFRLGAKDCTTPVSEVATQEKIILYPNPAQNELTIEVPDIANTDVLKISISTLTGSTAQESTANSNEKIDISALQNGLYFCSIFKNGTLLTTNQLIILK